MKPEVIVAPRVPCSLPHLPAPIALGGVPSVGGDTVTVTRDGLAALAGYLVAVRAWIGAASGCLAAEGP